MLGDGGITTLGLTIANLALVPAFVGYPLLLALRGCCHPRRLAVACGLAAAVCVLLAAAIFVAEFDARRGGADRPARARRLARSAPTRSIAVDRGRAHRADRARRCSRCGRTSCRVARDRRGARDERSRVLRRRRPGRARPAHAARRARARRGRHRRLGALARRRGDPRARARRTPSWSPPTTRPSTTCSRSTRARRARACASPACTPATRRSTARCTSSSAPAGALGLELRDRPRRLARSPAAAAALGQELTIPDVSQSLILTRRAQRTSMPPNEELAALAAPRHDDGAVPLRPPPARAAGRAARGRLRARHAVRRRLPGELAGRDRHPLPAGRARRRRSARRRSPRRRSCSSAPRSATARAPAARTSTTPATATATARSGAPTATAGRRAMEPPELREPNLPASARRVANSKLRRGWTTGTCATAAAKAACLLLRDGDAPAEVEVALPRSEQRAVVRGRALRARRRRRPIAVVVKDAGDDPDVTHGAHLTARVTLARRARASSCAAAPASARSPSPGSGSRSAARPSTRARARRSPPRSAEVVDTDRGRRRGRDQRPRRREDGAAGPRTPGSGIVGGISILGTTGIVRPFSTAAWRASVVQADRRDGRPGRAHAGARDRRAHRARRAAAAARPARGLLRRGRRLHRRRAQARASALELRALRVRRHGGQAHQARRRAC